MKQCVVSINKKEQLCPDPRIFEACVYILSLCTTEEDIIKVLERYNKLCEDNKCPYLKEVR